MNWPKFKAFAFIKRSTIDWADMSHHLLLLKSSLAGQSIYLDGIGSAHVLSEQNHFRYPKQTMETVEELSYGVVNEYRENQKGRLKRTFVSGSDAAGAKVNRTKAKWT